MPEERLGASERARITLPNVLFWLIALGMFGALSPVFYDALGAAADLTTGTALMFRLFVPTALVILIAVIWQTATQGVS